MVYDMFLVDLNEEKNTMQFDIMRLVNSLVRTTTSSIHYKTDSVCEPYYIQFL